MRSSARSWLAICLFGFVAATPALSGTYSNVTQFALPSGSQPQGIVTGPDGALWVADYAGYIVRLATDGSYIQYPACCGPDQIVSGPDGALWFTEWEGSQIGRITTSGTLTGYTIESGAPGLNGLTVGPDGAMWFTESNSNKIGRITTDGAVTEYAVPTFGSFPHGIVTGPDGALWFTEVFGDRIGRITTQGAFTEYPVTTPGSLPEEITLGPDGALWFTELGANKIGRITTSGAVAEYRVNGPSGIIPGPDGALWFTSVNGFGRITVGGVVTVFRVSGSTSDEDLLTTGPDGTLWFTQADIATVAHAPFCALGFSASFNAGTLTMNYNLGITTPATFNILLANSAGPVGKPFSKAIGPVTPVQAFTMIWSPFPNLGAVTVHPVLATGTGDVQCSEWATVDSSH